MVITPISGLGTLICSARRAWLPPDLLLEDADAPFAHADDLIPPVRGSPLNAEAGQSYDELSHLFLPPAVSKLAYRHTGGLLRLSRKVAAGVLLDQIWCGRVDDKLIFCCLSCQAYESYQLQAIRHHHTSPLVQADAVYFISEHLENLSSLVP